MVVPEGLYRSHANWNQEYSIMSFSVYLSGEIHTDWREEIKNGAEAAGLDI